MKKISIVVRQSFLAVTICIFAYAPLIHAVDIQRARIQEKVILHVAWGSGKGRIGEVPGRLEGTPGESINPIAVDSKGNIYVADSVHYRVQKYNSQGNFQSEINLKNLDEWPYKNIPDICVDSNDNIYIALLKKQQIVQFSPGGKLISTFDISKAGVLERNVKGDVKLNVRKNFRIKRIIVDKIGSIYVLV